MPQEDPFYHKNKIQLDVDSLFEVFDRYVQMSPIHQTVALRSTNWQIRKAIDYALFKIWNLTIELKWHDDRIKNPEPKIIIQGSYIKNLEKAMECLDFILENARMITELSINIGINNGTRYLEPLLTKFLNRENVSLEILKIRRRYIGETFPIISDLIYENSETLRIIGKIGLQEAVESFTEKIKLERLSLMNFDLITDGNMESNLLNDQTRYLMTKLSETGAEFQHLSYTTFTGFEFSRSQLRLLQNSNVKSLRLTMQKGSPIPFCEKLLLINLQNLEFIAEMKINCQFIKKQFPNLNHFEIDQQDLAS